MICEERHTFNMFDLKEALNWMCFRETPQDTLMQHRDGDGHNLLSYMDGQSITPCGEAIHMFTAQLLGLCSLCLFSTETLEQQYHLLVHFFL